MKYRLSNKNFSSATFIGKYVDDNKHFIKSTINVNFPT